MRNKTLAWPIYEATRTVPRQKQPKKGEEAPKRDFGKTHSKSNREWAPKRATEEEGSIGE